MTPPAQHLIPRLDLLEQRLIPRPGWIEYFMALAKITSTRSTCSSRPVGCVVVRDNRVLVSGYNGAPSKEPHCTDRNQDHQIFCARRVNKVPDDLKFEHCPSVHAEENALRLAERLQIDLAGTTLYTTLSPCGNCLKRLEQHGISEVYYELAYKSVDPERDALWDEIARQKFKVYQQASISEDSLQKLVAALFGLTSERLLPSG